METIEMDLMQAQIGSLATEISRLEAKVANSGSESKIEIVDVNDITFSDLTTATGTASKSSAEINDLISAGKVVFLKAVITGLGTVIATVKDSSPEIAAATQTTGLTTSGDTITEIRMMSISISPTNLTTIRIYKGTF